MIDPGLEKLIRDISGMPLWEVFIGLCGINMQFGRKFESRFGPSQLQEGEITLWIQCNTRILEGGNSIHFSLFPQDEEEEEIFKKYLENNIVTEVFINETDRSLTIQLAEGTTFIAYPWTKESDKCWIAYDHRIENPPGLVVFLDNFEIVE
jgi:hypothetical protein